MSSMPTNCSKGGDPFESYTRPLPGGENPEEDLPVFLRSNLPPLPGVPNLHIGGALSDPTNTEQEARNLLLRECLASNFLLPEDIISLRPSAGSSTTKVKCTEAVVKPSLAITSEQLQGLYGLINLFLKEYERDNAVFSPISIAIVIELYLEGVCSLPVEEITQALHKPSHNATSDTIAFISKAHGASFTEAQMRYFQDHGIDWSPDIDIAAINKLVAEATNHKIENFLQPGPYQNLCYNVLHFKRSWKRNFFDSSEISRPFTSLNHPEGMPPYQVKSIQTDRAETLRCAEVEMPEGRKLDLVAIPCEQVSAQKDMPEMHAVLAIPDTLMTEKTLPLYREALFSSFSELQWSDQLATITMPESTLRTRDENVGRLLAKHPDERVRAAAKEVFPHMITEAYLKCNNRGFEGSAATAQMALCAPSGIARNPRNFSVTGPYFVLIGIYLADGKFLPLMAEQVVKPEGALTLA